MLPGLGQGEIVGCVDRLVAEEPASGLRSADDHFEVRGEAAVECG